MKIKTPKKLIEVNLPLKDINEAAAREKSIRHGHPSTLHLWWARRPLAAARAVIFAQMVNDPGGERGWAKGLTKEEAEARRQKLFGIIRDLVKWENTNNEEVLARAREEIWKSWRETCALNKGVPGFDPEKLPAFHDPFAGGGTLPLEAQRLGLESYASDLNPVAVMINKAMIEIPPKFAGRAPIGPIPKGEEPPDEFATWPGATGLAEDVRRYGYWMREEAKKRIGHLYPPVEITKEMAKSRPDLKQYVGQKLTVIAWLWARTVKSPNPQFAHVDVPLVSSFVLSAKAGKEAYVQPIVEGDKWHFEVRVGKPPKGAELGTTLGKRKGFRCVLTDTPIDYNYIRDYGKEHGLGQTLFAVVLDGPSGRIYIEPTPDMEELAKSAKPSWKPSTPLPDNPRDFKTPNYGLTTYGDLFTDRQLTALNTFSDLVQEARKEVIGISSDTTYANAIVTYLTFAVDKSADYWSSICTWHSSGEKMRNTFGRQAIPMSWDYAEVNPLCESTGNWRAMVDWIVKVVGFFPSQKNGNAVQTDAQTQEISREKVISTDPPYYDNIGYADLSDYFYIWMRRGLRDIYPELFSTMATPKTEELVATPYRHGGKEAAELFFMDGMTAAMHNLATLSKPSFPVSIYYAFKQSETDDSGTSNAGWESFLEAVIRAGFAITGTWPIRTELENRMIGSGANALASSIVLVCRKRAEDAITISRPQFLKELRVEMHVALMDMTNGDAEHGAIAPVDLQQAAIGPGMGVYSKYKAVQKMDGSKMSVHEAMLEIMKEIDSFLNPDTALKDVDSSTRFFVEWFKVHGFDDGPFGEAQTLATAKNTTVQHMVDSGVAVSGGGKMRILNWEEYPDDPDYDPREDDNLPLWEACHRIIRELKTGSERKAATLLAKMPAKLSDGIYHLAYYLYDFCTKQGDAANARVYNALATSWEDVLLIKDEIQTATAPVMKQGEFDL
ncbi:MAG: DUF1156 domain-containing protein [Kiritimatiellae bacterium]|nr:DUF1156 domain-containing protein [Kiritimatiellia bacterium]